MSGPSFAIMRHGRKLKTSVQIGQVQSHNNRDAKVPNSDPALRSQNELRVGTGDLAADINGVMMGYGIDPAKVRSNGVLARELMFTASPEFMKDPSNTAAFKESAWQYIDQKWGDRLAAAWWHGDETTGHWQVVVVPALRPQTQAEAEAECRSRQAEDLAAGVAKKRRVRCKPARVAAKEVWNTKADLVKAQDDFAAAMQPLGLARGLRGSKAKHQRISQFYENLSREDATDKLAAERDAFEIGAKAVLLEHIALSDEDRLVQGPRLKDLKDEKSAWSWYKKKIRPATKHVVAFARRIRDQVRAAVEARVKDELADRTQELDRLVAETKGHIPRKLALDIAKQKLQRDRQR
jgi:hypothetical protein